MDPLANGKKQKRLVIGGDEGVMSDLLEHYTQKGLQVACLVLPENQTLEDCDIILSQVYWDDSSVYLSPVSVTGEYYPNILIKRDNLTREQLRDQINGFLEGIGF